MWLFDRIRSAARSVISSVESIVKNAIAWFMDDSSKVKKEDAEIERAKMINIYRERLALKRQQRIMPTSTPEVLPVCHAPILQSYVSPTRHPAWVQTAYNLYARGEIRTLPELKETLETLRFLHARPQLRR